MREPKLLEVRDLDPGEIETSGRLRPVSDAAVDSLIASITELGVIKDEVIVRKVKHQGGKLVLIAGAHRVEACRRMGRKVPAKIYDCADDWARLMELDDNLAGAELNALDTAVFLAERKRVYEKLHPETKQAFGADLVAKRWNADTSDIVSFVSATSEKFGLSKRQIERIVAAGSALSKDEIRWLRKAPASVTLKDLQEIAKIGDDDERAKVCIKLSNGDARTTSEARKAYAAANSGLSAPAPKDPAEEAVNDLLQRWKRAKKEVRKRFVKAEHVDLFNLLKELDGGLSE